MKNIIINTFKYFLLTLFLMSCEKFIDEKPFNQISNDIVMTSPSDANALVLGMYADGLQDADAYGQKEIGMNGVLSDELDHTGSFPTYIEFERNTVSSQNLDVLEYWDAMYEGIFLANFVLENIENVTFTDQAFKNQLIGEAKWGRASFSISNN